MELSVFLLFVFATFASTAVVKWVPNKSFSLPVNFKDGKLPCPKQTVVFPETTIEPVEINHELSVSGLILPYDGEILVNGVITLGADANAKCKDEGNAYYLPRYQASWNEADVWASDKFNEATPDAERIPCFDDEVQFPDEGDYTVIFPDQNQHVSALKLRYEYFQDFETHYVPSRKELVRNKFGQWGVRILPDECHSRSGCQCQENTLAIDCTNKYCPKPKCVDPVKPMGHCCKICGGFMTLNIDESFDFIAFKEHVRKIIDSYGDKDLVYHIGRISGDKVQVVVIEKGEYSGVSAYVTHMLEVEAGHLGMMSLATISGSPLSKAGQGWTIFFSMLFGVILVMGAIYLYHYKLPEMPELRSRFSILDARRGVTSQLARFNRRTDSVISLTRRDSGASLASGTPDLRRSFRNPLYDSKRGRVQVAETVPEEDSDSLNNKVY